MALLFEKTCPACGGMMKLYLKTEDIKEVGFPGDVCECVKCRKKFKSVDL